MSSAPPNHVARLAPRCVVVALLGLLWVAGGCRREPEIAQYEIDTRPPAELTSEKRLVGAIVPRGESVWFFKLLEDAQAVGEVAGQVRQVVQRVRFVGGAPQLSLPDAWTQRPGTQMRFATVEIPSEPLPLELTVSRLSRSERWDALVRRNVNRWRGQLGLDESNEAYGGAEPMAVLGEDAETPAVWVDLTGRPDEAEASPMAPPMMRQASGGGLPPAVPGGSARGDVSVDFDIPRGWSEGRSGGMRKAAFVMGEGDRQAELTVIPSGGDLRSNIRRWLEQIRPAGVDEAELDSVMQAAERLQVAGREAQRFQLSGTGTPPTNIDGTVIPLQDGRSLFIKMTGPAETVTGEADRIGEFLASLQISNDDP